MKTIRKKIITGITVAAVGVSMLMPAGAMPVMAATPFAASAWEGAGTEADPYQIGTADDLMALAEYINGGRGTGRKDYFVQTADISLDSIERWAPIGNATLVFSGIYHGDGYEITDMHATGANYVGLFGHIAEAELYDIHVSGDIEVTEGSGLTGYRYIGGLAGCSGRTSGGSDAAKATVVEGCVSDVDISSVYTGNGGLVGKTATYTELKDCLYTGSIRLEEKANYYADGGTGGILGFSASDDAISGCANYGVIANYGSGDTSIGGILGNAGTSSDVTIANCYNTGDLSTAGTYASSGIGGIMGKRTSWYDSSRGSGAIVTVQNCYNAGAVTAPNKEGSAGGIIGYTLAADSYGDPVITDANTSHVYSLYKKAAKVICSDKNTELSRTIEYADTFRNTQDEDEGIPWLLEQLGDSYQADPNYKNGGFPLLSWQDAGEDLTGENGRAVITVSYDTEANRATGSEPLIEIDGKAVNKNAQVLSAGEHTYKVSETGYQTAEGTFTVENDLENIKTVPVKLTAETYTWVISVVPAEAEMTLYNDQHKAMTPVSGEGGTYTYALYNGDYTLAAKAEGYYDSDDVRHGAAGTVFTVGYSGGSNELVLNVIPETAPQEPEYKDGYYLITKPQELAWINEQATSIDLDTAEAMAAANIRLMADLDMTGYDLYPMNGLELAKRIPGTGHYSGGNYTGIFDGNGHVINNLTLERENLAFGSGSADRVDAVGALFGYTKGAQIKNVGIRGSVHVSDAPASGYGDYIHVGGIVGMAQSMTEITGCFTDMDIYVDVTTNAQGNKVGYYYASDTFVGGIAGSLTTGSVVTDCYSSGSVGGEGTLTVNAGGIAGSTRGDYHEYDDATNELIFEQQNQIIRCYSSADISSDPYGSTSYIGGIVGMVRSGALGKIPEIYCNFALNQNLTGSSESKVEANRVLGNTEVFAESGFYNYAKDTLRIINAKQAETESNAKSSYGIDIGQADAILSATYTNVGWTVDVWNLDVLNEYPHLAWEDTVSHVHSYEETVTPPTCYEYGYTTYTCTVCGEEITGSYVNPAHSYGGWEESTERANSHVRVCSVCGAKETKSHTWGEGVETKEPTCTEAGEITYTCTDCGAVKPEYTSPAGHVLTAHEGHAPTCEKAGNRAYYSCSVCGSLFADENGGIALSKESIALPATGHAWKTTYRWSSDKKTVTANAVCAHDSAHKVTKKAGTTYKVTKKATKSKAGTAVYTATFGNSVFKTQKKTVTIPKVSLAKPKIKVTAKAGGKATISWQKVKGATGYIVAYKKAGTTKWKTKTISKTKITLGGLKKGTVYRYKVAAVKKATKENVKTTGNYSAVKKVRNKRK